MEKAMTESESEELLRELAEGRDYYREKSIRLRLVLHLIATPARPDGTWNRDREACRQLAQDALDGKAPETAGAVGET
jgi:hypothetical protein